MVGFPCRNFWVSLKQTFYSLDEQFQENQEILLVNDFPLVTEISSEEYAQAIVEVLEDLSYLEEPILVLFTAKDFIAAGI